MQATALIADDEPLLRDTLVAQLALAWPDLNIVAQARNGREAVEHYEAQKPDICFLDVHMPGLTGIDAAKLIGRRAHLVFVTAFDQYALTAFDHGALDYLVKPVLPERLADTVARLQSRLASSTPAVNTEALLAQLAEKLAEVGRPRPVRENAVTPAGSSLRWIRATVGQNLRLILVDDIDFLRSDEKYTLVAWRDEGKPAEALIRTPLKDLLPQLDAEQFAQVHRSAVVNLNSVSHVVRGDNETADIHLKGRREVLKASRTYLHLFRQM